MAQPAPVHHLCHYFKCQIPNDLVGRLHLLKLTSPRTAGDVDGSVVNKFPLYFSRLHQRAKVDSSLLSRATWAGGSLEAAHLSASFLRPSIRRGGGDSDLLSLPGERLTVLYHDSVWRQIKASELHVAVNQCAGLPDQRPSQRANLL